MADSASETDERVDKVTRRNLLKASAQLGAFAAIGGSAAAAPGGQSGDPNNSSGGQSGGLDNSSGVQFGSFNNSSGGQFGGFNNSSGGQFGGFNNSSDGATGQTAETQVEARLSTGVCKQLLNSKCGEFVVHKRTNRTHGFTANCGKNSERVPHRGYRAGFSNCSGDAFLGTVWIRETNGTQQGTNSTQQGANGTRQGTNGTRQGTSNARQGTSGTRPVEPESRYRITRFEPCAGTCRILFEPV